MRLEQKIFEQHVGRVLWVADDLLVSQHVVKLNHSDANVLDFLAFQKQGFELPVLEDLEQQRRHQGAGFRHVVPVVAEQTHVAVVAQAFQNHPKLLFVQNCVFQVHCH